jgi:hypothetical protein
MSQPTTSQSLLDLERDVAAMLNRAPDDESTDLLGLYLDLCEDDYPLSPPLIALADDLLSRHDKGAAALDDSLLLALLELTVMARPESGEPFARYAGAHARTAEEAGRRAVERLPRLIALRLARGASLVETDRILTATHGATRAQSLLCRHWRRITGRAGAEKPRPDLIAAARRFARSQALGMLSCLCVPALQARLGRMLWVEEYPTLRALVTGWADAAPGDPALLRALGAVSAEEAQVLEQVGTAIQLLLDRIGRDQLTDATIHASPELTSAITSARRMLPPLERPWSYVHALPAPLA